MSAAVGSSSRDQLDEAVEAMRPALQLDGADLRVLAFDEASGVVELELMGASTGYEPGADALKVGIERVVRGRVDGVTAVRTTSPG